MEQMLETPEAVRLTIGFLRDRVGMSEQAVDVLVKTDDTTGCRTTEASTQDRRQRTSRNIRGLIAIQSLLLSAYTPAGAAAWMRHPSGRLAGSSPREVLSTGDDDAVSRVLAAAAARMAT